MFVSMTRWTAAWLLIVQVPGVLVSRKDCWTQINPQKQNSRSECSSHFVLSFLRMLILPKRFTFNSSLTVCVEKQSKTKNFYYRILLMKTLQFLYRSTKLVNLQFFSMNFSQFSKHFLAISQIFLNWNQPHTKLV